MKSPDILETDVGYNRFNKFKILAHAENIERLLNGQMPKPIVVDLELSNFCNQSCIWCEPFSYRMQAQAMLSPETIKQAIEDAAVLGARMIRFCGGGEPMTNPFYSQSLQLAKEKNLGVISNSNGSLLHRNLDAIVRHCDYFRVSLDAATSETYRKLHKPTNQGDFDSILRGLTTLTKEREKKASRIEIGVAYLIHYENFKEIDLFTSLMQETGVDFVHFRPAYLLDEAENQKLIGIIEPALERIAKCREHLESEKFKVFGITRKMRGVWFKREWNTCHSPFLLPVLGADGRIYACCDRRDLCLGNFATEGFAEVYRSNAFRGKVANISAEECARCTSDDLNDVIFHCFEQDCLRKYVL